MSLETTCCVVGGGPAGVILSLLLARAGVDVTLLEAHKDFDRDFRGDTIHPSTLELVNDLGLAEALHALPHRKLHSMGFVIEGQRREVADFRLLKTRFPYIMILPQSEFLAFLVEEAKKSPTFHLVFGANVQQLIEEGGAVRGVRYQQVDGGTQEVKANLTVAADGRFSRLRKLAGMEPKKTAPPMDIVWLRLPRKASDNAEELAGSIRIGKGHFAVVFDRPGEEWQIGYAILKGTYAQMKTGGVTALRKALVELMPAFADRVDLIQDFNQVQVLSVESSMIPTWHKPGLLLLGDAAHVMSPVGGIGIQYAVQDAVAAHNLLVDKLRQGSVTDADLATVQKEREPAARFAQKFQRILQEQIVAQALQVDKPFRLPLFARIITSVPVLKALPARFLGFGWHTARLRKDQVRK